MVCLQAHRWSVVMKPVVQAAGGTALCKRQGSATLGWIPPRWQAIAASVGPKARGGRAPVAAHAEALGVWGTSGVAWGAVPAGAAEAQRQLPRALDTLKPARARTTTRIKGVLRSQGRCLTSLRKFAAPLKTWRRWMALRCPVAGGVVGFGWRRRTRSSPQSAALEAARRVLRRPAQASASTRGGS